MSNKKAKEHKNEKLEKFKAFLEEKDIKNAFVTEAVDDDELNTVLLRSQIDVAGNRLPTLLIFDDSVYVILRILIAPKVPSDESTQLVLKLVNDYNKRYKAFKYYLDDSGALLLDVCILSADGEKVGNYIYAMYDVIIQHLRESYHEVMRLVWS